MCCSVVKHSQYKVVTSVAKEYNCTCEEIYYACMQMAPSLIIYSHVQLLQNSY